MTFFLIFPQFNKASKGRKSYHKDPHGDYFVLLIPFIPENW